MRFTHRIMALPILTAVVFALAFAFGFANLREGTRVLQTLQAEHLAAVDLSHTLSTEAMRIRHELDAAVSLADPDLVSEADGMAEHFRETLVAGLRISTIEHERLTTIAAVFERYQAQARRVTLRLIAQDEIADTDESLLDAAASMNVAYADLRDQLDRLNTDQTTNLQSVLTETRDSLVTRARYMTLLALAAVIGLVVLATGAIVAIVNPLRKLRQAAAAIARGDLNQDIDHASDDDLGQLADSFREMQRALETDIARREEVEHALRESEARLALALDAANDGIWDVHVPRDRFYCSDRFAAILGYAPEEKPTTLVEVDRVMDGVDPRELTRLFAEERPDDREVAIEARLRRKDGTWAWVEIKGRTVERQPDGTPLRMVGTISDISARKAAEEQLRHAQDRVLQAEKLASLGRLVAGLAHELNSPLGALVSSSDLTVRSAGVLRERLGDDDCDVDTDGDARLRRALVALERSGQATAAATARLDELLGGLKRFAALDRADLREADVSELLETTVAVVGAGRWEDVEVVREYGDLPRVLCAPGQLNQLFLALVTNAVEAMDGRGTLTLRTRAVGDDRVRVTVGDTGRGIPDHQLAHLFEPRFSADGDRMHLGWGLVTAARIVEDHGGQITAASEEGRGSMFTVTLPVTPQSLLERQ